MLIAITQKSGRDKNGNPMDFLERNYVEYLEKFGIKLLIIPNSQKKVRWYFDNFPIEGVILSGGEDVDPRLYGKKRDKKTKISIERDLTEKRIMDIAVKRKMPVLGICRGLQFINVYFGGNLIKDIKGKTKKVSHTKGGHKVRIVGEKLKKYFGKKMKVNSFHHQGISYKKLSSELKSFAESFDGLVEGAYHPDYPIVGIQWHPERKNLDFKANGNLLRAFVKRKLFWKKSKSKKLLKLA